MRENRQVFPRSHRRTQSSRKSTTKGMGRRGVGSLELRNEEDHEGRERGTFDADHT